MPDAAAKDAGVIPDENAGKTPGQVAAELAADAESAANMTAKEERSALDFLLGPTKAQEFDVPVKIATSEGDKELTFRIRQLDGDRFEELEKEHRDGEGPFSRLNRMAYSVAIVAEATLFIADATGDKVDLSSERFIGKHPLGIVGALKTRFKYSPGIFPELSAQVESVSGYGNDRVGTASRAVVDAVGN